MTSPAVAFCWTDARRALTGASDVSESTFFNQTGGVGGALFTQRDQVAAANWKYERAPKTRFLLVQENST